MDRIVSLISFFNGMALDAIRKKERREFEFRPLLFEPDGCQPAVIPPVRGTMQAAVRSLPKSGLVHNFCILYLKTVFFCGRIQSWDYIMVIWRSAG